MSFTAKSSEYKEGELFLDYFGLGVERVVVNGNHLSVKEVFNHHRITLPSDAIALGENIVEVVFRSQYRNDGMGLMMFKDQPDEHG